MCSAACLYVPPISHTAGTKTVGHINPAAATRTDVLGSLGRPNVLRTRDIYVYTWDQNFGTLILAGNGGGAAVPFTGKNFHVLIGFNGDRVARYEYDADPAPKPDETGEFNVREARSANRVVPIPGREDVPGCILWSRTGERCILESAEDRALWIHDLGRERGALPAPWPAEPDSTASITGYWGKLFLSPDGRRVFVSRSRKDLHAWDLEQQSVMPVPFASQLKQFLDFSRDGAWVVWWSRRKEIVITAVDGWREVARIRPKQGQPASVAICPNAARAAASFPNGEILVIDTANGTISAHIRQGKKRASPRVPLWSPDCRRFVTASVSSLEFWDLERLENDQQHGHAPPLDLDSDAAVPALRTVALLPASHVGPAAAEFSPDGSLVVAGNRERAAVIRSSGETVEWCAIPHHSLERIPKRPPFLFAPDGRRLLMFPKGSIAEFDLAEPTSSQVPDPATSNDFPIAPDPVDLTGRFANSSAGYGGA